VFFCMLSRFIFVSDGDRSSLANHPSTIRLVVVPALQKECAHADSNRRLNAARALGILHEKASVALPSIAAMLCNGAIDRSIAATVLRSLGARGESELTILARADPNARVRAAAARALGNDVISNKSTVHISVQMFGLPGSSPSVMLRDGQSPYVIDIDARILIAGARRALANGEFNSVQESLRMETLSESIIQPKVSALMACFSDSAAIVREAAAIAMGSIHFMSIIDIMDIYV